MSVFITSDLHLDHKNIIRYCNRPFRSVEQMNRTLIDNWNSTIKPHDTVYFLGDLSFQSEDWIPKLHGHITFIKGNHDRFHNTKYYNQYVLKYEDIYFFLVHNPRDIPESWQNSWKIFGHVHQNGDFFNSDDKRINISTDVTNFYPVNMNKIIKLINLLN